MMILTLVAFVLVSASLAEPFAKTAAPEVSAYKEAPPEKTVIPWANESNSHSMAWREKDPLKGIVVSLNQIMYKNFEMESLREEDYRIRHNFIQELEEVLSPTFPSIEFVMYGSSCNGFGTKRSDMDISVFFGNETAFMDEGTTLKGIVNILKRYPLKFSNVTFSDALAPIVKLFHAQYRLAADISYEQRLAIMSVKLVKTYADIDQRVAVLVIFLKSVRKMFGINGALAGGLPSFGFNLLVIHYLQQMEPPVLPVLQELCHDTLEPAIVGKWDVRFYQDIKNLPKFWPRYGQNNMSVGELWLGFLHYYVEVFQFDDLVISVRTSSPVTKASKNGSNDKGFIAIENPFDLSLNVSFSLSPSVTNYILTVFDYMLEACYSKCVWNQMREAYESWRNHGDVFILEDRPMHNARLKPRDRKKQKAHEETATNEKRLLERKVQRKQK